MFLSQQGKFPPGCLVARFVTLVNFFLLSHFSIAFSGCRFMKNAFHILELLGRMIACCSFWWGWPVPVFSCPLYPSACNNHPDGSWEQGSCSCSFEVPSFVPQQSACPPHGLGAYSTCSSPLLPFSQGFVVFPMFAWSFYFIFRPLPSLKSTIYWTLPCQDLALVVVSTLQLLSSITRLVCWV